MDRTRMPGVIGKLDGLPSLLCEETFSRFCGTLPKQDISEAVLLLLVEADIRLLRIAGARARRDFTTVALEADAVADTADRLGLLQARTVARQLANACFSDDRAATYGIIGQLSEIFQTSAAMLDALLRRGTGAPVLAPIAVSRRY